MTHSSEIEQLQLQIRDMNTQTRLVNVKKDLKITELNHKIRALENQVGNNSKILLEEREQFAMQLTEKQQQYEEQLRKEREMSEIQLDKERQQFINEKEANRKLMASIHDLQAEVSKCRSQVTTLQSTISKFQYDLMEKNTCIEMKDASAKVKDSEIVAKNKILEEKDATISEMNKQLTNARGYLATIKQVPQACISWKQCAELPIRFHIGSTTVINAKVYCGGGETNDDIDKYTIYCYDPSRDKWATLPPLPVKYFSLGQVNGKLVAVGGEKGSNLTPCPTNEVYTYNERSQKWKHTIPPMPTARHSVGVLSLQSALVVAGGDRTLGSYIATVEIFKLDTSQWYRTDPLPIACSNLSLVDIGNTCYALGGYRDSSLNQAFFAANDDLLCNAVPANQTTHSGSRTSDTQSAWKTLPDTLIYQPTAAMLAGSLLALGGQEISAGELEGDVKEIYIYSPSTNSWIYISDLPAPRSSTTVAILSKTEILVMGGWSGGANVQTVYMGTFTCTMSI